MKLERHEVINMIIKKYNYKSYLEIGTQQFINFDQIIIENKECVDPMEEIFGKYTYNMTSDDAFIKIKMENKKYDIIFIDGLHYSEQVTKDIKNALDVLNTNGTIVLHDCNPPSSYMARYPLSGDGSWYGDCFKSIIKYKIENPNIFVKTVNTCSGLGIIEPYKNSDCNDIYIFDKIPDLLPNENDEITGGCLKIYDKNITWDFFNENRNILLNLINVDEFTKLYSI